MWFHQAKKNEEVAVAGILAMHNPRNCTEMKNPYLMVKYRSIYIGVQLKLDLSFHHDDNINHTLDIDNLISHTLCTKQQSFYRYLT